jgi:hypothetical protein
VNRFDVSSAWLSSMQERFPEQHDVLPAIAKRRHADREHAQPVEEVLRSFPR